MIAEGVTLAVLLALIVVLAYVPGAIEVVRDWFRAAARLLP